MGRLILKSRHRLICGDSTDAATVARLMAGEKADCVFTSPPYSVGVEYDGYQDTIENLRKILDSQSQLFTQVVVPGGFAVLNFGDVAPGSDIAEVEGPCEYPMALEYWPRFRAAGWVLWSRRVWCKPNPRVHSLQCIGSNRAATDWEHVWTWKRPGPAIVARVDGKFASCNGWIDTSADQGVEVGKEVHGAGMAVSIAARMIVIHSRENAVTLEPFCGTGTTMIAAQQTNRRAYCCEQSPAYCDISIKRFEKLTGEKAVLHG